MKSPESPPKGHHQLAGRGLWTGLLLTLLNSLPMEAATYTWTEDIAPLVHQHCLECHRAGQVAPFPLLSYEDVAKRADFVARAVASGYMPPWLPARNRAHPLAYARGLTTLEQNRLRIWAAEGAPHGPGEAPEPPPPPPAGWRLGEPDLIVTMDEAFTVPAVDRDLYQVFVLPLNAAAVDPGVRARARIPGGPLYGVEAIEIQPGNPKVVHHAIAFVDDSGTARELDAATPEPGYARFGDPGFPPAGYLGGYVPGTTPHRFPAGVAEVVPLPSDLVLQIHYSPSGKPEADRTRVGLYFSREPVLRANTWLRLGSFDLDIPAGEADFVRRDALTVPTDVYLLAISPHMHYLGKTVEARAVFPDGTMATLISVPDWDFNWQDRYFYREPILLPAGTRIEATWIFDNSAANPRNPHDPPRDIRFGAGSGDEMCELHLDVIPHDLDGYEALARTMVAKMEALVEALPPEQRERYAWPVFGDLITPGDDSGE